MITNIFVFASIIALLSCSTFQAGKFFTDSNMKSQNLKSASRSSSYNLVDNFPDNQTLRKFENLFSLEIKYPHIFDYDSVAYPGVGPDGEYKVIYGQHVVWKLIDKSNRNSVATIFVVADDNGCIDWNSSNIKISNK